MSDLRISVTGPSFDDVRARLVEDKVASGIAARDATLWGPDAESEAAIRLGWVDLPVTSRPLLAEIDALQADLRAEGLDRVVLCGMGGSSLAPEVITRTAGVELTVLDTTDPQVIRRAIDDRLDRTVVVVSSKSGGTLETDSQRRAFLAAFEAAGIDGSSRIVVVTDPGSGLAELAANEGYRKVFLADPEVGGRYSALTAFGLVPSGLAGADIASLLDDAEELGDLFAADSDDNPALVLGAALGGTQPLRDKIAIADADSGIVGFADWSEQLIAESTGKHGKGLLPVVVEGVDAPELRWPADDVLAVRLVPPDDELADQPEPSSGPAVDVGAPLGAQLLLWEYATAIAGRLLGINPFDQPDVESAKAAARGLLDARPAAEPPAFVDGVVEVRGTQGLLEGIDSFDGALEALLGLLDPRGYVAVMAYLDREADAALAGMRQPLALRCERPVTFGWGPRFLHSTGQFHKGGPPIGVFLQVTGASTEDLPVPDRPYTFGQLITAQAAGDAQVLADHGRPVLRLHLTDRAAGVAQLLRAVGGQG